jgi:hypothetical protein
MTFADHGFQKTATVWLVLMAALAAIACAGAEHQRADSPTPFEEPNQLKATSGEQQVLQQLDALPAGQASVVGEYSVMPEAPYQAASGRTCRKLTLNSRSTKSSSLRLACSDGTRWQFVPDVFSGAPES